LPFEIAKPLNRLKGKPMNQTVSVKEYARAKGMNPSTVHKAINRGEIPTIKTTHHGVVLIPKRALVGPGFKPNGPLNLPATLSAEDVTKYLGIALPTLRRMIVEKPDCLVTFPLGRSFGVTTESLYKLLGHPISDWPELPEPETVVEVPANREVAQAVAPTILELIGTMRHGLNVIEAWAKAGMPEAEPESEDDILTEGHFIERPNGFDPVYPTQEEWEAERLAQGREI
jgi:hypothetical protein